jgi:hypothetical protein
MNWNDLGRLKQPAILSLVTWLCLGHGAHGYAAQVKQPSAQQISQSAAAQALSTTSRQTGCSIHGTVKTDTVPLPGVRVTATDTLTGKTYSAATDATGGYSINLPQNGRYIVRALFTVFAPAEKETLLSASSESRQVDFSLVLASYAEKQGRQEQNRERTESRQYAGRGAESLSQVGSAADLITAAAGGGSVGAQLPDIAGNSDFSSESVAVSGQNGETNPFAGLNVDQLRKEVQEGRSESAITGMPEASSMRALGGGMGGGGRGRLGAIFRNFKPNEPHGAFYWRGGNGALNATDFPIRGQQITEPGYGQNQFGLTFIGVPYIPKLLEHDDKDFVFFGLSSEHASKPFDQYGTVPTLEERTGNLSDLTDQNGNPVTIYDPETGHPFSYDGLANVIPPTRIASPATALLNYIPLPNLSGQFLNYRRLTTADTNTTKFGFRYNRSIGSSTGSPLMGMLQRYLGRSAPGQSINVNYNYMHTGADVLNLFPELDGKEQIHQNSLEVGYSLGIGQLTNKLSIDWDRTNSQLSNRFTNTTDIASEIGLSGLPSNPMLYGLPDLTMNQFSNVSELQPNFQINQTISLSETSSWMHGKHNVKFGGDVRRVHFDLLGETNSTGNYTFTGVFTEQPGSRSSGIGKSGSSLADFLLGFPQQTSIQAPYQKAYLRENVYDAYAQDDWRPLANLTVLAGLRYEYFSPYSETNDRLATLDTGNDFAAVATVLPNGVGPFTGKYPRTLIYPERDDFSPRFGFAWNAGDDTIIRGGYGIDFTNGQYVTFAQDLAFQSPFADVQTNETSSAADVLNCSLFCLSNGFPAAQPEGNYAVNKNYRLPYIQVWNLNLQRTVPWNIVLNIGYSGSKGTRLDLVDAPGRTDSGSLSGVFYNYEDSVAFSNYNGLTVSARKRLSSGISLQGRYTYSHSIDDASSIGGNGGTAVIPAQNWQNLLAEESNSSFDIRHQAVGNFLYELPFGPETRLLTSGWTGRALSGLSASGTFDFASGEPLTPHYQASIADVARGSTGSLRPDRVPGSSLTAGGGSLENWFNKSAFADPVDVYGSASRFSIPGPGTVSVDASLSKTVHFSETRTFELRATADNVFNTVQYSTVDSTLGSAAYGQVTGAAPMRQLTFFARYRY